MALAARVCASVLVVVRVAQGLPTSQKDIRTYLRSGEGQICKVEGQFRLQKVAPVGISILLVNYCHFGISVVAIVSPCSGGSWPPAEASQQNRLGGDGRFRVQIIETTPKRYISGQARGKYAKSGGIGGGWYQRNQR